MKSIDECIRGLDCIIDDINSVVYMQYLISAQEYLERYKEVLNKGDK